jgi:hypothetical protein|eukprot:CAMPEP_0169131748 /NCGR_PEP_ID=MMETSP1015-20121227/38418_1 /TAXON_ID=342587 /ORGANISM="Karlodinium micrum, Strain CCMP2283" /LENGTH=297 /DNA_ID=CAMNT_0009196041 /DNA_START=53 /DNA_END=946 /DNA_ORIENTATION=-
MSTEVGMEEVPLEPECAEEELAPASQTAKRRATVAGQERLAKRPRWGDKAFEDITLGDVEKLVKRCNFLEKQVETNAEAVQQLKDAQRKEKELVKELTEVGSNEVSQAKSAIAKQLLSQMIYTFAWNQDLKGGGREICAYVPNVTHELLKALGGDVNVTIKKQVKSYFDKPPCKSVPPSGNKEEKPGGNGLVLHSYIALKYIKTTSELHVKTSYKFGALEKQNRKGKGKGKGKAAEANENVADDAADDDGEADLAPTAADGDDNVDKADEEVAEDNDEEEQEDANAAIAVEHKQGGA